MNIKKKISPFLIEHKIATVFYWNGQGNNGYRWITIGVQKQGVKKIISVNYWAVCKRKGYDELKKEIRKHFKI